MNKILLLAVSITMVLVGCKPIAPDGANDSSQSADQPPSTDIRSEQAKIPAVATPERIAEIIASGRTGFWSDVTEVCPKQRPIASAILTWNVIDSGAEHVVLYVFDPKVSKDEMAGYFGQGGPVGERSSGPWLKPGLIFKLRSKEDDRVLGSITIGEKSC